jgi:signal transduction histidine kinase/CheY-like chemotaxis protein
MKAGETVRFEVDHYHKDGHVIPLAVSASMITLDGQPFFLSSHSDISERKNAEAERQKMDKLQSVGTLAGGIAHDFNNILQGVYGNISFAKNDLPEGHPAHASLEEAEKSMHRAVRLTKQLLTFAKGGAPIKDDISLGELVEDVARFDLSGSNVSLVYRQAEDLWPVAADKGQIQQVVSNLVINARQAMPAGGRLTVTLENAERPEAVAPTLGQERYVKVTVQDEGIGIDPKVIGSVFDPYFTTKQTGNGLGLTTAWSIITKHGGHIGVVSEPGKGSTFTFHLPASGLGRQEESRPTAANIADPNHPARILVMDDDEMVRTLVTRMLVPCGYSVATASDGHAAIAQYRQALASGAPFSAVIMDLTIPGGIGGMEAVKALRELDPNVRAIVSSGYAEDPVMAHPAAYGFKGAAAKPYTAKALRDVVARVLA